MPRTPTRRAGRRQVTDETSAETEKESGEETGASENEWVIFILKHREFKNSVCKMDGIVYSVI